MPSLHGKVTLLHLVLLLLPPGTGLRQAGLLLYICEV